VRRDADERHYVRVGRATTVVLFAGASGAVYLMDSAKDTFDIILQVGAGTGLLYLVRWFWWRVNAWCEVVAMTSSLAVSIALLVLTRVGSPVSTHLALIATVIITTVCWVATAYLGPETDRQVLVNFYRKVRPFGAGWEVIRREAGLTAEELARPVDDIPRAIAGWVAGCTAIWSALFAIGNALYGRWPQTALLVVIFAVSGGVLASIVRRLWSSAGA
jgi:hypothetical protein